MCFVFNDFSLFIHLLKRYKEVSFTYVLLSLIEACSEHMREHFNNNGTWESLKSDEDKISINENSNEIVLARKDA